MLKRYIFVVLLLVMTGLCHAQFEVPETIRKFVEDSLKNPTHGYGFEYAKEAWKRAKEASKGFDGTLPDSSFDRIQAKDLSFRYLEGYKFKHIFLDSYPDTVPLSEIIEPSGYWWVLIMAKNKPFYEVSLYHSNGKTAFIMFSPNHAEGLWDPLLKHYPSSKGINPVRFSPDGDFRGERDIFLYFKQKGPRKVHFLGGRYHPLNTLFSNSIESLDDSKKYIEHLKKSGHNEVGISVEEWKRRHAEEVKNGGKK